MQSIAELLDVFRFAARRSGEREHSEMGVLVHELSDDLGVGVIALSLMCFVYVSIVSEEDRCEWVRSAYRRREEQSCRGRNFL